MDVTPRDTGNPLFSTSDPSEKTQENLLGTIHSFYLIYKKQMAFRSFMFHHSNQAVPFKHTTFDELSSDIMQIYYH